MPPPRPSWSAPARCPPPSWSQAAIDRAEQVERRAERHHPPPLRARRWPRPAGDLPDGPFAGVPFVLKDLDGIAAGQPLHAGTRFLKDHGYVATDRLRADRPVPAAPAWS